MESEKIKELAATAVVLCCILFYFFGPSIGKPEKTPQQIAAELQDCKEDLQCWG